MKDNWKKFADDHQEEFNAEIPTDHFHAKIAPHIPLRKEPRMVRLSVVIRVAAALLVLIGVSLFFILQKNEPEQSTVTAKKETKTENNRLVLAKLDPELAEAEFYYVSQIDQLMEEVEAHQLTDDVKELIKQLDTEFNLLKKEMGEQVNSNQIVEALIENYRLKIKLLEKILDSYSDSNNETYEKETTI